MFHLFVNMKYKYKKIAIIVLGLLLVSFVYLAGLQRGLQNGLEKISTSSSRPENISKDFQNNIVFKYSGLYDVTHIVDGDTIDIDISGKSNRVRLLGVNTPESVAQNRPDECYGREASEYLKSLLEKRKVSIELDLKKPERDEYGRILAYIMRDDKLNINKAMIEGGYAYEYTYKGQKYKYQSEFKQSQNIAKQEKKGLWASNTCAGKKQINQKNPNS